MNEASTCRADPDREPNKQPNPPNLWKPKGGSVKMSPDLHVEGKRAQRTQNRTCSFSNC